MQLIFGTWRKTVLNFFRLVLVIAAPHIAATLVIAQIPQRAPTENGTVSFYTTGGWSFGLPAVRATAVVPGLGSAVSPEKKTLTALSAGASVRAWKMLTPYVDFSVIDTGKAFAEVGPLRSEVEADTYILSGGLRISATKKRTRPYVQFGGGRLHQNLRGNFVVAGRSTPASASGSAGTLNYGAGLEVLFGKRWGSMLGFEGFRTTQQLNGAGRNFTRLHVGFFFQTKAAVVK